jgi:hypothetical protein
VQRNDDPALALALERGESPTSSNARDFIAKFGNSAQAELQPRPQGATEFKRTSHHRTHHVARFADLRARRHYAISTGTNRANGPAEARKVAVWNVNTRPPVSGVTVLDIVEPQ